MKKIIKLFVRGIIWAITLALMSRYLGFETTVLTIGALGLAKMDGLGDEK